MLRRRNDDLFARILYFNGLAKAQSHFFYLLDVALTHLRREQSDSRRRLIIRSAVRPLTGIGASGNQRTHYYIVEERKGLHKDRKLTARGFCYIVAASRCALGKHFCVELKNFVDDGAIIA